MIEREKEKEKGGRKGRKEKGTEGEKNRGKKGPSLNV